MIKRVAYFSASMSLLVGIIISALPPKIVSAAVNSCSVSMTPHQVEPGSGVTYEFSYTNTATETIQYMRINRPSAEFTLTSAATMGWSASLSADNAIFTGGGLDPGQSITLRVSANVNSSANGTKYWSMFVTDDPGGAGQFSCDGDLSVTVGSSIPAATISDISATNLTETSATIRWTTNVGATSQVRYGLTSSYGSSSPVTTDEVTDHSIVLTGLQSGTGYHYQVVSSNDGGTATSSNNTFQTIAHTSSDESGTDDDQNSKEEPISGPSDSSNGKDTTEKIPPVVTLTENYEGIYNRAPTIKGVAMDNVQIANIDYSIDGGITWLPVDAIEYETVYGVLGAELSKKSAKFTFTPVNLDDDNYLIKARVTDTSGNQNVTDDYSLIIDRIPPQVGGSLISVGPQILESNPNGVLVSTVGIDQKITMNSIGGASSIVLTASVIGNEQVSTTFSLSRSKESGLWGGVISFQQPGTYKIVAKATDGAGNVTEREVKTIQVSPPATIASSTGLNSLSNATVTVYYFVPQTEEWAVWDAQSYGQQNPQISGEKGEFSYFLPPGKFYLKVSHADYHTLITKIFAVDTATPLTAALVMRSGWWNPFWVAYDLGIHERTVSNEQEKVVSLVGRRAPAFSLKNTNNLEIDSIELNGKPTVLSFLSTWAPPGKEQLNILSDLNNETIYNFAPISVLESSEKVKASSVIADYKIPLLTDPTGKTMNDYFYQDIPTHVFIDRQGIIKKVMVGVLSREEMLENLAN